MFTEEKEDNHEGEMTESLKDYKLNQQTLKLMKEAKKEIFFNQAKSKVKAMLLTYATQDSLTSFTDSPLNTHPPLAENDPEA